MQRNVVILTYCWAVFYVLFLSVVVPPASCSTSETNSVASAKNSLSSLSKAIQQNKIVRIEVFFISQTAETYADISPDGLRKRYKYKLEIRCSLSSNSLSCLQKTVFETKVSIPVKGDRDFRWGLVAYSEGDKDKWEIDLARWGKNAEVNGFRVSISDKLYKWLLKNTDSIKAENF